MAVEKVTVQQAAGELLKGMNRETTADTNNFNNIKVNPFTTDSIEAATQAEQQQKFTQGVPAKALIFGSEIVEEPKVKSTTAELPQKSNVSAFSKLANYCKNLKYGINAFDSAVSPNVKSALAYLPDQLSLEVAACTPRVEAILREAGILPA